MRMQTKASLTLGALFIAGSAAVAWAADKPARVSGGGGFPLTASVTSMWGAVDEIAVPGAKPLTFMIYFRGDDGWHRRKWESKQEWNTTPFFIEFSCDLVTLRAEVDPATRILTLFGHTMDLAKTNVVMVDHVDRSGEESVTSLGHVNLLAPEDSNPAIWVLENNEAIRSHVVGSGN